MLLLWILSVAKKPKQQRLAADRRPSGTVRPIPLGSLVVVSLLDSTRTAARAVLARARMHKEGIPPK